MTNSKMLAAAAVLASALASPAMAQQVIYNPGYCAQFYPNANCQNLGPGSPYESGYYQDRSRRGFYRERAWRDSHNRSNGRDGISPGDVATGVAGAAVGTATAIATSPIGSENYARRNGFFCVPGTLFRGEDGRQHLCQ